MLMKKKMVNNELNIQRWMELAEGDGKSCQVLLEHRQAAPGPICFLAQQMVEKYLKALLIFHSKKYPKIHDLKRLATLLEQYVPDIFDLEEYLNILNKFYATTRYPADLPGGFSWKDAELAFEAASYVKEFVLKKME